jgi:hypothetical protein
VLVIHVSGFGLKTASIGFQILSIVVISREQQMMWWIAHMENNFGSSPK